MDDPRKRCALVAGLAACSMYISKPKRKRSKWSRNWLFEKEKLCHMPLLRELRENEPKDFKKYLRMTDSDFDLLLSIIEPHIRKEDTVMRAAIPANERLIATLYFLASGISYERMQFVVGIAVQTLGQIIPETCAAIFNVLKSEYMKMPTTKEEWKGISAGFRNKWQFLNCGGAVDGKHIRIVAPQHSGARYFNYKKFYSVVLMAVVSATYEFVYVHCGQPGRIADGGVIRSTQFYKKLLVGELGIPPPCDTDEGLGFVFIGDEAFALDENMLKVYPQKVLNYERRIFNYRVCRARNVVENVFGLIASKFRVLHTAIHLQPEKVNMIVLVVCMLHNFLRRNSSRYINAASFDTENIDTHEIEQNGAWRQEVPNLERVVCGMLPTVRKNTLAAAKAVREAYCTFYNSRKGRVPWQDEMLKRGRA